MPRSSCDHRALSPSGPPDGVRRCSLEGSAPRSSLPATSPSESAHSWWCHRSCLLAAVGGVQPHGSWHPSTIIRLQGFSSHSPVAISGRWSSTRMTTSLVVERSEPGCSLPPALSFKDVHHPRWGGGQAEWELRLPRGLAVRFFLQHSGEQGVHRPCGGGELWVCGAGRLWRRQLPRVWLWCHLRRCLLPLGRSVATRPLHGRWSRCARVGHIHGFSCATGCTGRSYKTSYATGAAAAFLDGLVLTLTVRTGANTSSCALVQSLPIDVEVVAATGGADVAASAGEAAHYRGGCLRWRDRQCDLPPDLRLFGFNGLAVIPRRRTGARTYSQQRSP
jgi:hypothetical protein